jgi:hypothetical protein
MSADLLQALQVVTKLRVDTVSQNLRILAINNIALSVEEPRGNLVLSGVLDDGHDSLKFFRGEFTGTVGNRISILIHRPRCFASVQIIAYRLFRSTSAFLLLRETPVSTRINHTTKVSRSTYQTKLEYRRPTPLIRVKAYITFSSPLTLLEIIV